MHFSKIKVKVTFVTKLIFKILKNRSPNLKMPQNTDLCNPEIFFLNSGLDDIKL
jgi:hypothetical protein